MSESIRLLINWPVSAFVKYACEITLAIPAVGIIIRESLFELVCDICFNIRTSRVLASDRETKTSVLNIKMAPLHWEHTGNYLNF